MADVPEVGITAGIPTSGTGTVKTLSVIEAAIVALQAVAASAANQDEQTAILEDILVEIASDESALLGATSESAAANPSATSGLNGILKGFWTEFKTLGIATTATLSAAASSGTSAQLLASTAGRKGLSIENTDENVAYLKYGTTASTTSFTARILPGGFWTMHFPVYTGRIDIIWAADGTGSAYATELT